MPKMTKSHNFVKNKRIKNLKSYAYLQIMAKHSAKFQINSIKDVAGVSKGHNSTKMADTKIKNHVHILIRKQSTKFKVNPTKDVEVAGTRSRRTEGRTDGRTDGRTHGRTMVISIVPSHLRRVTKSRPL